MKAICHYCLFAYLLLSVTNLKAQDPIYSQFFAAPLQTNPASVGNTLAPRITLNYRNQWVSFNNAFVTYSAAYEQLLEPLNSSIGLMIQTDNAGDGIYQLTNVAAIYGYRLEVNRDFFLKIGIEVGGGQLALDWQQLVFLDQLDAIRGNIYPSEEIPPINLSKTYLDIGTGLMAYGKKFYGGISFKHVNAPSQSLLNINDNISSGLPMRTTLHAGGQFTIKEGNTRRLGTFISPNLMFIQQGNFGQLNGGAYIGAGSFFGGAWYRHAFNNPDALIFLAGVQYGILKIGYSYDFTVSNLAISAGGSGGAHEISVTFNFEDSAEFRQRKKASRYNDCLKIFR